jgi:hypothetical protein
MAADGGVDGAVVQAGAAADAAQHLAHRPAEHLRAAVVDQYHVVFLRAVEVVNAARAGTQRGVGLGLLAGGAAGQQAQEGQGVVERRHHALDAAGVDVHPRQRLRQVAVAFVRDDDARAGLGDEEVPPVMPTSALK